MCRKTAFRRATKFPNRAYELTEFGVFKFPNRANYLTTVLSSSRIERIRQRKCGVMKFPNRSCGLTNGSRGAAKFQITKFQIAFRHNRVQNHPFLGKNSEIVRKIPQWEFFPTFLPPHSVIGSGRVREWPSPSS